MGRKPTFKIGDIVGKNYGDTRIILHIMGIDGEDYIVCTADNMGYQNRYGLAIFYVDETYALIKYPLGKHVIQVVRYYNEQIS